MSILINEKATRFEVEKHRWYWLKRAGKNDTVILFFSGHGSDDPAIPGAFFFLTHEADPDFLQASALNMSGLQFVQRLDSKRVVLIADTCRAGGFSVQGERALRRSLDHVISRFTESEGKIILTSARSDELSIERPEMQNGVFTYYLLKGLKGEADLNNDGVVSLREAYEYVYEKTKDYTNGRQHPRLESKAEGLFPLALTSLHPTPIARPQPPVGPPPAVDKPTEMERLRARAESGDADAQFTLGNLYYIGEFLPKDGAAALRWYKRAAAKGHYHAKKALERLKRTGY